MLSEAQMRQKLRRSIKGEQQAWAEAHGIHPVTVSQILNGHRDVSSEVAAALGYRIVKTKRYERIAE